MESKINANALGALGHLEKASLYLDTFPPDVSEELQKYLQDIYNKVTELLFWKYE